ncbi:MAG TPA: phosphoglucomutase/phosphomannomutase family protein [Candidatus Angelobacter sp.]|nr:phosphoglucomutase/phosphomannomutase family protein [Candidatus Angelobacter sp.]
MAIQIKFGTSGWRAIIADEFTVANVRRAVTGIARHLAEHKGSGSRVIVGRDPRYMGESFVHVAAEVLAGFGIQPLVIPEPAPTPAIAYEVVRLKADGAINFTASHNPPEYSGIKFSTADGAPALPEITKSIEALVPPDGQYAVPNGNMPKPAVENIDPRPAYLARLKEIVDLPLIRNAGLKIVYDPLWGAARGYPDHLLREAGIAVSTVHDTRDVLFGGHAPEPDGEVLNELREKMKATGAHIGISTDGDADRFGIVDQDGSFIAPNFVIALLFDYLVETRGWKNGVGKSVTTTNMINALAMRHGVELYETPVGFKYLGELIKQDKIAIGGEESAGLSIRHHVPEKDGVLACLLCCEAVARRNKPLKAQIHDLFGKVGSFYPQRENFHLTPDVKEKFTKKLKSSATELSGRRAKEVVRTDGLKLVFEDGSWVCYRMSGTEPVVRIYAEARSEDDLQKLAEAARTWVFKDE